MFCDFSLFFRPHKTLYMFTFYSFHNSQWKIGSDLFLFWQADTYKAHTSDISFFQRKWFLLLWKNGKKKKNPNKTKKRKHHQCTATKMTKKVPKNNKTVCTSLLWCRVKGKLLDILCAVTQDCKAILTLLTKSLQYLMAVHILNLRALEKTILMISYKTKHVTIQHFSLGAENCVLWTAISY